MTPLKLLRDPLRTLPKVEPIAPRARPAAFNDPSWPFEPKYDGFRGMVYLTRQSCSIYSKRGSRFSRLEELQGARDLSQAELARRSGVPQSTISRIEGGETGSITLANLERLAEALGVNAELLIVHEPKGKRG